MFLDIVCLVGGLVLIILGAEYLTRGSIKIASRLGVSELVIGLTIIALGTSAPEMIVSIFSAARGESDMALGNVIGSNLFNALFIIGVTSILKPIPLSKSNVKKNIPSVIVASVMLLVASLSLFGASFMPSKLTRVYGVVMVLVYAVFMWRSVKGNSSGGSQSVEKKESMLLPIVMTVAGLGTLIYGGNLFLDSAVKLSRAAGISEFVISATLMAGGTSLPELASCIAAARKGRSQLALGNVIGSNVANILLVLGSAAAITPISLEGVTAVDIAMVVLSSVLLIITPFTFKTAKIDRVEGAIFVALYVGYVLWLVM